VRLIYYSLANTPGNRCERQWIYSIRSLRCYNARIPVWLFLFNGASAELVQEAERWGVHVLYLGNYDEYLKQAHTHGSVLALYPTFHKFLTLGHAPFESVTQILYLDCDTFFFGDAEALFEQNQESDWYAREEPMSRRSHYRYNPTHIDENLLGQIAQHEGLRRVAPFNSGVCLLNRDIWTSLECLRMNYLDLAWRLLCGRELYGRDGLVHDLQIQQAVLQTLGDVDRSRALPYPSANTWIIEQIALWLALGYLHRFSQGTFSSSQVLQGGEFQEQGKVSGRCVLVHYYSTLEDEFFSSMPSLPD
jgi:hypothetical protein